MVRHAETLRSRMKSDGKLINGKRETHGYLPDPPAVRMMLVA